MSAPSGSPTGNGTNGSPANSGNESSPNPDGQQQPQQANADNEENQQKRRRTDGTADASMGSAGNGASASSASASMSDVGDSAAAASAPPAAASSSTTTTAAATPAAAASAIPVAVRAHMLMQMRRFMAQVTVGCQRAGCTNPDCVTGGHLTPLTANQAVARAQQLFKDKKEPCVPPPAGTDSSAASTTASAASAAPTAARSSVVPSTPMPSSGASAVPATPHAPARPSGAPAATPPSPAPFASLEALSTAPRAPRPVSSFSSSSTPASSSASAAANALAAAAASPSSSRTGPSLAVSPRASPSLTDMLAKTQKTPLKSTEAPIESAAAWVAQVDAARAAWEAAGSPPNDLALFRPLTTRIYRVFNELNCLALSFRVAKDKEEAAAAAVTLAAPPNPEDVTMKSAEARDDAMVDDAAAAASAPAAAPAAVQPSAAAAMAAVQDSDASPYLTADEFSPALDYTELDAFYASILSVSVTDAKSGDVSFPLLVSMLNGMRALLNELLMRPLGEGQVSPTLLRAVFIMLENAELWSDPSHYDELARLLRFVAALPRVAKKILVSWYQDVERWTAGEPLRLSEGRKRRMYSLERLERLLGFLQQFISVRIFDRKDLRDVVPAVVVISLLHEANEHFGRLYRAIPLSVPRSAKAPVPLAYQLFNNDAVNELADLKQDFRRWMMQQQGQSAGAPGELFSFSKYNFILDAGSKATLLKYDAAVQMQAQYRDSLLANGMDERAGYLVLEVARANLIPDTMRQLANKQPTDLKKPLKIHFKGEKGIDAGGLRKEFFQLIIAELFDPRFGMFLLNEETRTLRFNPDSMESTFEFELLGVLLGIAIYNSTILDMHFPQVVYKQLLGQKPTLDDLLDAQPSLAKGLLQLLEFDGDVEAVFARDFTYSYESYGAQVVVPLKPNGDQIPVTKENRAEFVQLYVEHVLEKSVARQFGAFSRGFLRVCGGPALQLFRSEELELLICGAQEFDFAALEESTNYEDGYTRDSPICKQFWEIVHEELTLDEKKKLLEFCTGSDRVPIKGLSSMRLTISKQGPDSAQLPTSHTCFNHLLLPQYESKDKLRTLLKRALQNSKGFGLI